MVKSIFGGFYKFSIADHTSFLAPNRTLLVAELRQDLLRGAGVFLVACRGEMGLFLNLLLQFLFTAEAPVTLPNRV